MFKWILLDLEKNFSQSCRKCLWMRASVHGLGTYISPWPHVWQTTQFSDLVWTGSEPVVLCFASKNWYWKNWIDQMVTCVRQPMPRVSTLFSLWFAGVHPSNFISYSVLFLSEDLTVRLFALWRVSFVGLLWCPCGSDCDYVHMAAEVWSGRRASLITVVPPTEAATGRPLTVTQFQSMWVAVTLQGYTARGHRRAPPSSFTQIFIDYMLSVEPISWGVCACACMFLNYSVVNIRAGWMFPGWMSQASVTLIRCHL